MVKAVQQLVIEISMNKLREKERDTWSLVRRLGEIYAKGHVSIYVYIYIYIYTYSYIFIQLCVCAYVYPNKHSNVICNLKHKYYDVHTAHTHAINDMHI